MIQRKVWWQILVTCAVNSQALVDLQVWLSGLDHLSTWWYSTVYIVRPHHDSDAATSSNGWHLTFSCNYWHYACTAILLLLSFIINTIIIIISKSFESYHFTTVWGLNYCSLLCVVWVMWLMMMTSIVARCSVTVTYCLALHL